MLTLKKQQVSSSNSEGVLKGVKTKDRFKYFYEQ